MKLVPFSEKELKHKGFYKLVPAGEAPVYSSPVTPKENYKIAMSGKKPFWMPMFTDCRKFLSNIIPDNVCRGLIWGDEVMDLTGFTGGTDMFGILWDYVPEARGATVRPGSPFISDAEELMEKTIWPDITSWDWAGAAKRNEEYLHSDFVIGSTIFCGFFERLISFMDFENAAVALIDDDSKEYVHAFFERLTQLYEEMIPMMKKYFNLDLIEFHDDWGSQRAPLFGIDTLNEMILPYLKRVVKCVHDNGMFFEMHSCGCHAEHTPAMIEAGVDYWAPQYNANNTMAIFEEYGDKITIGLSCPLPPGSPEEEYVKWAHEIVDKCVGREDKRTPMLHNLRTPEIYRRTVYELSRKKLCGC